MTKLAPKTNFTALEMVEKLSKCHCDVGQRIAECINDAGETLGYVVVTDWLAARPTILVAKVIKDTGSVIDSVNILTEDDITARVEVVRSAAEVKKIKAEIVKVKAKIAKTKVEKAPRVSKAAVSREEMLEKYADKIISGSLKAAAPDGQWKGKQTVEIRCKEWTGSGWGKYGNQTRRVATSDLFQVEGTADDHVASRLFGRRERNAAKKGQN